MANNRAWLKCRRCEKDNGFHLFKYYPHTGWYFNRSEKTFSTELDNWFEKHKHGELFGAHIYLDLEVEEKCPMKTESREQIEAEIAQAKNRINEHAASITKVACDNSNAGKNISILAAAIREDEKRVAELSSKLRDLENGKREAGSKIDHQKMRDDRLISEIERISLRFTGMMIDSWAVAAAVKGMIHAIISALHPNLRPQFQYAFNVFTPADKVCGKTVVLDPVVTAPASDTVTSGAPALKPPTFIPASPVEILHAELSRYYAREKDLVSKMRDAACHYDGMMNSHKALSNKIDTLKSAIAVVEGK